MKYSIGIIAVVAVVSGLCSGCDKDKEANPEKAVTEKVSDAKWEPETAAPAAHEHGAECDH